MDRPRTPRRRPETPSAPTSLQEITRRYVATALALSKAMGLPYTEMFLREHRESVTSCFIQAGMEGIRLAASVTLPAICATASPAEDPSNDTPAPEAPPANGTDDTPAPPPPNSDAPLPTRIPSGDNWPCAGHEITKLKPAQLHLLLARAGFRAHADTTLMPLLAVLQAERAKRMERGKRRNGEGPQE